MGYKGYKYTYYVPLTLQVGYRKRARGCSACERVPEPLVSLDFTQDKSWLGSLWGLQFEDRHLKSWVQGLEVWS